MKDRIEIDGVWYVRESNSIEFYEYDFIGYVCECDDYYFEATRLQKEDGTYNKYITIKFTDKRGGRENWKDDFWDNNSWFRGILNDVPESLQGLKEDNIDIDTVKEFLKKLVDKEWL